MPSSDMRNLPYITRETAESMQKRRNEDLVLSEIAALQNKGIWVIGLGDEKYPSSLAAISDPPMLLYGTGRMPPPSLPRISIIGARKCSSYGLTMSKKLAAGLTSAGFVIVSGLALGIDAQAHKSCIDTAVEEYGEAVSSTIAVLGNGVDICYPAENRGEYERVKRHGAIISEYPPGTKPTKYSFPRRNRIITGLSLGIIVVEAAEKSGTSLTVKLALEQGREVFVLPGSALSPYSVGTNNLIKDGAIPVTGASDVLYALRRELVRDFGYEDLRGEYNNDKAAKTPVNLSLEEKMLYEQLSADETVDIDFLTALTGIAVPDALYFLSKMELAGLCEMKANGYVRK